MSENKNELIQVENRNGILVADSRLVARVLGVNHKDLLRKINIYCDKFGSVELRHEFYIENAYENRGKQYPMFYLTELGIQQVIGGYNASVPLAFEINVAYILEFKRMKEHILKLENEIKDKDMLIAKLVSCESEQDRLKLALELNDKYVKPMELKIEEDRPKVELYDTLIELKDILDMKKSAKILNFYNLGRNRLYEILRWNKVLMKDNEPYQSYFERGWFTIKESIINDRVVVTTYVTNKGLEGIRKLLLKLGYKQRK